jgi:HK97 family phage prohead protease
MERPSAPPGGLERRAAIELRAVTGRRLEGLAAPFDSETRVGTFREVIRPGAFTKTLSSGADILALVDHHPGQLLGRSSSGTLRLTETTRGLEFSIDVPETQLGNDVLALAQRGDIGGASIGFRAEQEAWPARDRRELRAVRLIEISIVHAHAAYRGTSVSVRSAITADDIKRRLRLAVTL